MIDSSFIFAYHDVHDVDEYPKDVSCIGAISFSTLCSGCFAIVLVVAMYRSEDEDYESKSIFTLRLSLGLLEVHGWIGTEFLQLSLRGWSLGKRN